MARGVHSAFPAASPTAAGSSFMHASRPLFAPLALLVSGAFSLTAASASAGQSCQLDSDCEHGFDCEVVGTSGCAAPACPPNADCPAPAPCDPTEFKECVPGPCT